MKFDNEEAKRLVQWGFDRGLLSLKTMSIADRLFVARKLNLKFESIVQEMNNTGKKPPNGE